MVYYNRKRKELCCSTALKSIVQYGDSYLPFSRPTSQIKDDFYFLIYESKATINPPNVSMSIRA